MSDDDPRGKDAPGAGSDVDDLHRARAGDLGEDSARDPSEPGIAVDRDLTGPRGESTTEDSTNGSPSLAAAPDPVAAPPTTERPPDAREERAEPLADDGVRKERSRNGWIIGGSVAAAIVLVAVIAVIAVTANSGSPVQAASTPSSTAPDADRVAVPDLVGMTVADARTELDAVGLTLLVPDGTDDQAIVATQTLSEGQEVAAGTEVSATVEEAADPEADSLGFADGAALDPLAMVGWQFSLGGDDATWTSSPDEGDGEVIFANSDGTCTAQYWQQIHDTAATDDLTASNEFLAEMSGATAEEMADYAFDGRFARSGGSDGPAVEGDVATRTLLWDDGANTFLLTARVFHKLDYATSTMSNAYLLQVQCDLGVDPQDVVASLDEVAKVSVAE